MKSLSKSEEGKPAQPVPQWIEAKVRHYNKIIYPYISFDDVCLYEIRTLCGRVGCRVMFKRETTSVDTMSCTGYGAL